MIAEQEIQKQYICREQKVKEVQSFKFSTKDTNRYEVYKEKEAGIWSRRQYFWI